MTAETAGVRLPIGGKLHLSESGATKAAKSLNRLVVFVKNNGDKPLRVEADNRTARLIPGAVAWGTVPARKENTAIRFDAQDLRGGIFYGPCPVDCTEEMGRDLIGQTVEVGGEPYTVLGVEAHAVIKPPAAGDPVGLRLTPSRQT